MNKPLFSINARRLPPLAAGLLLCASLTGCAGEQSPRLVDYLEELEFDAPTEATVEIPVGDFHVPIAVKNKQRDDFDWRRLKFKLYAVTEEKNEDSLEAAWKHYQGQFQDEVLFICRSVTADELEDPRLAGMKMRLTDMARALLGKARLQQLVMKDINDELL